MKCFPVTHFFNIFWIERKGVSCSSKEQINACKMQAVFTHIPYSSSVRHVLNLTLKLPSFVKAMHKYSSFVLFTFRSSVAFCFFKGSFVSFHFFHISSDENVSYVLTLPAPSLSYLFLSESLHISPDASPQTSPPFWKSFSLSPSLRLCVGVFGNEIFPAELQNEMQRSQLLE